MTELTYWLHHNGVQMIFIGQQSIDEQVRL